MNITSQDTKGLLKNIELIAEAFKENGASQDEKKKKKIYKKFRSEIDQLASFLKTNEEETWLFCVVFAMNINSREAEMEGLTQFLGISPFQTVGYIKVLNEMMKKRLLYRTEGYDMMRFLANRYQISGYVFDAIVSEKQTLDEDRQFEDVYGVIERVNEMIVDREKNNRPTQEVLVEMMTILKNQKTFPMLQRIIDAKFSEEDIALLIYLFYAYANDTMEADVERFVMYLYDSIGSKIKAKKNLLAGTHKLLEEEWIDFAEDSYYGGKEMILTDKAIDYFFASDMNLLEKQKSFHFKNCTVLSPEKIRTSPLFFNNEENKQISFFSELLVEDNYLKAIHHLQQNNIVGGLTSLFYGAPGTGKTQVAYNLATETNRTLLMIDMANVRDKYVGESEKRVKQIFKNYRRARTHFERCPILFFNESDGLISKRVEVDSSVDQMSNTIQNILLQEMEDFEGILIATSNLNMNLDAAFERRFLYKIRFDKPDKQTRKMIWQAKMPHLQEKDCELLAHEYELSGGQINNVMRKYILINILQQEPVNIAKLRELCIAEYFGKSGGNVGFKKG